MRSFITRSALVVAALGISGCALLSRGDALNVRWFDPATTRVRLTSQGEPSGCRFALELGRVSSGGSLRERIAYRDSAYEVGFYEDRRWTERPDVYVRRALARTLFEEHGLCRVMDGGGPVLDVELLSFEELRRPARAARIALRVVLHDDREVLLERTITIDRPLASGAHEWDGFVGAMAEALDAAAEDVAKDAEAALERRGTRVR